MDKILFINACVRDDSRTYRLAKKTIGFLNGKVTELNLQNENIMPLDNVSLKRREDNLSHKNYDDADFKYAKEFATADTIVIAAPYWDLSFPANLKAYLEQICVVGITFAYGKDGKPTGKCQAKRLIYITTAGGYIGKFNLGYEYVHTLAKELFQIDDIAFFKAEGLDIYNADCEKILKEAEDKIELILGGIL